MKTYSQFRSELMRKKVLENLAPVPPQSSQQPVPPQNSVNPKNSGAFFKGMNFAPGRRWEMMKRVQQNQSTTPPPGQPPMPQMPT